MSNIQNQYQPKEVSPPGETLRETLECLEMSPMELAERMDMSLPKLRKILKGKAPLTPEIAVKLEFVLGVPAHFWNHRERHYRDYLLRCGSLSEPSSKVLLRRSKAVSWSSTSDETIYLLSTSANRDQLAKARQEYEARQWVQVENLEQLDKLLR